VLGGVFFFFHRRRIFFKRLGVGFWTIPFFCFSGAALYVASALASGRIVGDRLQRV